MGSQVAPQVTALPPPRTQCRCLNVLGATSLPSRPGPAQAGGDQPPSPGSLLCPGSARGLHSSALRWALRRLAPFPASAAALCLSHLGVSKPQSSYSGRYSLPHFNALNKTFGVYLHSSVHQRGSLSSEPRAVPGGWPGQGPWVEEGTGVGWAVVAGWVWGVWGSLLGRECGRVRGMRFRLRTRPLMRVEA